MEAARIIDLGSLLSLHHLSVKIQTAASFGHLEQLPEA
jgi:hypothetical protein